MNQIKRPRQFPELPLSEDFNSQTSIPLPKQTPNPQNATDSRRSRSQNSNCQSTEFQNSQVQSSNCRSKLQFTKVPKSKISTAETPNSKKKKSKDARLQRFKTPIAKKPEVPKQNSDQKKQPSRAKDTDSRVRRKKRED